MKEIVFLNGKFLSPNEAKICVLTPGFLYGWGLFESMRSYNNKIVYFDEHFARLKRSAELLDMRCPCSLNKLKEIIWRLVRINSLKDAYIRLTLWKCDYGQDMLVTAKKYEPYSSRKHAKGLRVCVSSFRQSENPHLTNLKSTNYLLYRLAYAQATKLGFDDALILNNRGNVIEASRSNLFFVKGKELFTPSLECGCLKGVTRQAIFDLSKKYNIKIFEGNYSISDLCASDEAFITNSLMGIMPLASIEGRKIGKNTRSFVLTHFFMKKYKSLLGNET